MTTARKSDFTKWIDYQVATDADLAQKVEEYLNEMMIEQKLAALRSQRGDGPRGEAHGRRRA